MEQMSKNYIKWFSRVAGIALGLGLSVALSLSRDQWSTIVQATSDSEPGRFISSLKQNALPSEDRLRVERVAMSREIVHSFGCGKEFKFALPVREEFVRFKGSICGKKWKDVSEISITNDSNGFTASVFGFNNSEYLTDLIKLNEGRNEILITYQGSKGLSEEKLILIRKNPSIDKGQNQAYQF